MLATRWEPLFGMNRLQQEMNQLFHDMGRKAPRFAATYPQLNLFEDEENYYVEAELPGLAMDDLEIYVTAGNKLSMKGERQEREPENANWHRRERAFDSFHRSIELPTQVDSEKVSAALTNGVLTISLPKSEEAKPRKITVKAS